LQGIKIQPINGGFAGLARRVPNAASAALNRVAASARASAAKTIASDIGIKQSVVRDSVVIHKATSTTVEAQIVATGKRIPIIDMGARQTARGVTYKSGAGRKTVPGAFIARVGQHTGVFKRFGRRRLPIGELFGPSLVLVFKKSAVQTAMRAVIRTRMPVEMESAARHFGNP